MEYIITSKNHSVISTSINEIEIVNEILECDYECMRVFCNKRSQYRREGVVRFDSCDIFLASYNQDLTNRIFKHYIDGLKIIGHLIDLNITEVKETEKKKIRRLRHNLINHNSNTILELYNLIPQKEYKDINEQIKIIENTLIKNTREAAFIYLKVLKNSSLMKAEFEVYDMLDNDQPYLDFDMHKIHKVVILTLNPFWLDLVEKNIEVNINQCYSEVYIDYKSISVALSHIFDNATKYLMSNSVFNISFIDSDDTITVVFDMLSLKIEEWEKLNLFKEEVSGEWSNRLGLNGDGLGMFIIKELIELNKGNVELKLNKDGQDPIHLNNIPYEKNQLEITLNK